MGCSTSMKYFKIRECASKTWTVVTVDPLWLLEKTIKDFQRHSELWPCCTNKFQDSSPAEACSFCTGGSASRNSVFATGWFTIDDAADISSGFAWPLPSETNCNDDWNNENPTLGTVACSCCSVWLYMPLLDLQLVFPNKHTTRIHAIYVPPREAVLYLPPPEIANVGGTNQQGGNKHSGEA